MTAVLLAVAALFFFASILGALTRLRAVCLAIPHDLERVRTAMGRQTLGARRLILAMSRTEDDVTGQLAKAVVEAADADEAQALVNEAVFEMHGRLSWGEHFPATFARICLFGTFLTGVILLSHAPRFSDAMIDIVGFGAAGAIAALTIGSEARRRAAKARLAVDQFVDRAMGVCWPKESDETGSVGED